MAASGKVLKAAASYGGQVRGRHDSSGHSHQIQVVKAGNKSTTVVGLNTNSILLQFMRWAKKGTGSGILWTGASTTQVDYTGSCTLGSGKVTHTSSFTNCLFIVSWDQPDA